MKIENIESDIVIKLDTSSLKKAVKDLEKQVDGLVKDIEIKVAKIDPSEVSRVLNNVEKELQRSKPVIKPTLDLSEERAEFAKIQQTARDTGKVIDQELKSTLEIDVAKATLVLKQIRQEITKTTDKDQLIKLNIEARGVQSQLTEFKRGLNNLQNTGTSTLSRLQSKFDGIAGGIGRIAGPLGLAGVGIAGLATGIFNLTSSFQKYEAILRTALGSQEKATEALSLIRDIAKETPFEVNQLTEAYIKLVNRGFIPTREEIIKLGDLASSQGKDFNQLTEALLDAQTGEFERLKEFGVKASASGNQVAFTFKGVTTTVAKTDEAIKKYVLSLGTLQGISGSMAEQSKTLGGQFSNLLDSVTQLGTQIGNFLAPVFSGLISILGGVVTGISGFLSALGIGTTETAKATIGVTQLNQRLADNKSEQDALNKAYKNGSITLSEYTTKSQELADEQTRLQEEGANTVMSVDEINEAYQKLNANGITTKNERAELKKLADEAYRTSLALNDLYNQRLAQFESTQKILKQQQKDTTAGLRAEAGQGNVQGVLGQQLIQQFALVTDTQAQLNKASKTVDEINGKIGLPKSGPQRTKPTSSGGSKGESESDKLKKVAENQKKIEELGLKTTEFIKKQAIAQFEAISKQVDDTQKKIDGYNEQIKKLQEDLASVDKTTSGSIAGRAVEIQQLLRDQNLELEKRKALEAELALALANTNEQDLARANLLATESQTEKILREAEERKAVIQAQIVEQTTLRDEQIKLQQGYIAERTTLEKNFTAQFQGEIDARKQAELSAINEIKAEYAKLRAERETLLSTLSRPFNDTNGQTALSNTGNTINQVNNFNINNGTDAEAVARTLGTQLP